MTQADQEYLVELFGHLGVKPCDFMGMFAVTYGNTITIHSDRAFADLRELKGENA